MYILLLENDQAQRLVLQELLQENGSYSVAAVTNGQEALEAMARQPVDMLIMDGSTTPVAGPELLRAIRSMPDGERIFVIVLGRKGEPLDVVSALHAGADDYVVKPFALEELMARVTARARRVELDQRLRSALEWAIDRSKHDPLTGILNRQAITEQGEAVLALARHQSQPVSIALLDLDYFKEINDRYGHDVGDEGLRWFTQTIQPLLRANDRFGRWGGDEFVLLLPGTSATGAEAAVERIYAALRQHPFRCPDKRQRYLSVSVGIAEADPALHRTFEELVTVADKVLYRAKHTGRNRVQVWAKKRRIA